MNDLRCYNDLAVAERQQLFAFTAHHDPERFPDQGSMERAYASAAFEHGASQFSLWDGGQPRGTMAAVVREADLRGEIFITAVALEPAYADRFGALLERTRRCMPRLTGLIVRMGISPRHPHVEELAGQSGFRPDYEGLIMTCRQPELALPPEPTWRVEVVDESNREAYRQVLDLAFRNSPNGATVDAEQIAELMAEIRFPDLLGLAWSGDRPVAAYELDLQEDVGWVEAVAVAPGEQGRGFGKRMLAAALERLREHGATSVKLLVMSTNETAVKLYRQHGFGEEVVTARWWRWTDLRE